MAEEEAAARKKVFFDALHALDSSTDEEDLDYGLTSSVNALKDKTLGDPTFPAPAVKQKSSLARSLSTPLVPANKAAPAGRSKLSRVTDSTERVRETPIATLQKSNTVTGIEAVRKIELPPSSTAPPASAVPRGSGKRKREAEVKLKPDQAQVFRGLHFYFFPNSDVNPSRRNRIIKALEYGATWQKEWNTSVTHVIADNNMNYDFIKLKVANIPTTVIIVDEGYPADCIQYGFLVDPTQKKYLIPGYDLPAAGHLPRPQAATSKLVTPSQASDKSLQLKPPGKAVMARQPETPARTEETPSVSSPSESQSHEKNVEPTDGNDLLDELEAAIRQAKETEHLPLGSGDEDDSRLTSSPNEHFGPQKNLKKGGDWQDRFQCMHKHTGETDGNPNAQTILTLQEMVDFYAETRDPWRPKAYRSAIAALRQHQTKISTKDEALRLHGIGVSIAEKIEEIITTSHLRKLDYARLDTRQQILQTFTKIYGVGYTHAERLYAAGHRTLDSLRRSASELTANQRIGLAHYDDFNARIPRSEVARHAAIVSTALKGLDASYVLYTMGSYRRGAETSGDIDLILTHPTAPLHQIRDFTSTSLIPTLFRTGFLVATLAGTDDASGSKWHGASVLPSAHIWRRIDFLFVPDSEIGAALIYFTGNDIFNRSLRLLASKKGMRLNQRGLYRDVLRGPGREKVSEGVLVEGRSERGIFRALGVPWRVPEHRIP